MMRFESKQQMPAFSILDINGNEISNATLKGEKAYLVFNRFAGCPICNLRFHTIENEQNFFETNKINVVSFYETSLPLLREYVGNEMLNSAMVASPGSNIYKQFGVERSWLKLFKSFMKGGLKKVSEGNKLFKKIIKADGNMDRIGAEFLIDENGIIIFAHYHEFVGDDLPVEKLKELFLQ